MKYLNLKLRRDIRRHWQQFFSVFLMSLLSVLIFVGLQGAWYGLEKSLDSFISKSSLPDVWIQADSINNKQIEELKKLSSVKKVVAKTNLVAKVDLKSDSEKYISLDSFDDSSQRSLQLIKEISYQERLKGFG